MKKFTSTFIGASILITFAGMISKSIGLVREIIYAYNFGIEVDYNIFLVGAVIPIIINSTFIYFGQNYFIPKFNNSRSKGISDSYLLSEIFLQFILIGFFVLLVLYIFSDAIINFYLSSAEPYQKAVGLKIFNIYIYTIPLFSGNSILAAYFQSKLEFTKPVIAQVTMNIIIVVLLLFLTEVLSIYVIPIAFLSGAFIQISILIIYARRELIFSKPLFQSVFNLGSFFEKKLLLTLMIELCSLSYILIDRYFYERVDEGGLAVLSYASSLFILPISIFAAAMSTAIFPKFSNSAHNDNPTQSHYKLKAAIELSVVFFSFITLLYFLFGNEIIAIIYERGKFGSIGTELTFNALLYYSISIVFFACYSIFNKYLYSYSALGKLFLISVSGLIVKIIINLLLVDSMKQDGLALGTSLAFIFLCISSYFFAIKEKDFLDKTFLIKNLVIYGILTLLTYAITSIFISALYVVSPFDSVFQLIITVIVFGISIILIKPNLYFKLIYLLKYYKL